MWRGRPRSAPATNMTGVRERLPLGCGSRCRPGDGPARWKDPARRLRASTTNHPQGHDKDRRHDPELVAADVEHEEVAGFVDAVRERPKRAEVGDLRCLEEPAPGLERAFRTRMGGGKIDQRLVGDDPHPCISS